MCSLLRLTSGRGMFFISLARTNDMAKPDVSGEEMGLGKMGPVGRGSDYFE